jgi:putative transposase
MVCQLRRGTKLWLKLLTDLRNRGVRTVCVVCCDGLTALPDALEAVFADGWVQCGVVHLIRKSLKHVSYKDRKQIVNGPAAATRLRPRTTLSKRSSRSTTRRERAAR